MHFKQCCWCAQEWHTSPGETTCGETLSGCVVGITDGDTITVLVERQQVKVRLADIDAPESKQAFGTRSKQALRGGPDR
jgi:endonuclease YncB( thermonuclease family)